MLRIIISILCLTFSFSQTINDITSDDLAFFEKFDHWYTSTVAGDSSAYYYDLSMKNRTNHPKKALHYFKSAFSFSQKNDRYNLSNVTVRFSFIYRLIHSNQKENVILAEKELKKIEFLNTRNIYIKKMLLTQSELEAMLLKKQKLYDIDIDGNEKFDSDSLRAKLFFSIQLSVGINSNSLSRTMKRNTRTLVIEKQSYPFGLGLMLRNDSWKLGINYVYSFFDIRGLLANEKMENSNTISLFRGNVSYVFHRTNLFNTYAILGFDFYEIKFSEISKTSSDVNRHYLNRKNTNGPHFRINDDLTNDEIKVSSMGYHIGLGLEYYLKKSTSLFGNITIHTFSNDLIYTQKTHNYFMTGLIFHFY